MRQYEAVVEAMKQNGGYATLGRLYQTALSVPNCKWGTKTPFASIRRIVQTHPELFFRIKPGLWGLEGERQRILSDLGAEPSVSAGQDEFSHTYFQGLVVEIGTFRGYETHVPRQDRNRLFVSRSLGSTASLQHLPGFTYDKLVRRASTVDVTWINTRGMPSAFFEIEHSTDMRVSLLKFLEFQDFRAQLYLVADGSRRSEFQGRIAMHAFSSICPLVRFLDYESVSKLHTAEAERFVLSQQLGICEHLN